MSKIYDSDYSVRLATLGAMGGDTTKCYDSVYEIDLEILKIIQEGGGGGAQIDDDTISTTTAWSSSKIVSELAEKADISYVDASLANKANISYVDTNFAKLSVLTQAQYDALVTKDASTLYIISDAQ